MTRRGSNWTWTIDTTAQRIDAILTALNKPATTLAAALNVSVQSVRAWRRGVSVPGLPMQKKLETIEQRLREKGMM